VNNRTSNIPTELRACPQWLTWHLTTEGQKIPNGKSNDPKSWKPFDEVSLYDRIAFVFSEVDPFVGIDLDSCRVPETGEIKPWAMAIIRSVNSYCEVSPSGTGVKIILRGRKPKGTRCQYDVGEEGTSGKKAQVEVYDQKRFWCITGEVLPGFEAIREAQTELNEIIEYLTARNAKSFDAPKPKGNLEDIDWSQASTTYTPSLQDRATRYIDSAASAAEGSRNNSAFSLAGHLAAIVGEGGSRLTESEIIELVRGWNTRNRPPLPDHEIVQCVKSALNSGTPRADKDPTYYSGRSHVNTDGVDVNTTSTGNRKSSRVIEYRTFTATELDAVDCRIDYLVSGVLVENQPTMLVAPQKGMKTTLSIDLCLSLSTGSAFLDHFTITKQCRTLLMTGESGLGTVQETARRIAANKGHELRDVGEEFIVSDEIPLLYSIEHLSALKRLLETIKPRVLVADPVYLMVKGDNANNLFSMGEQIKPAADLCRELGITFILVHHAKNTATNVKEYLPLELGDISWTGFSEFARQWLFLNRRETYALGSGSHKLWFSYGGSAGHSGCWAIDIEEGSNDASQGRSYRVSVAAQHEAIQESIEQQEAAREARRQSQEEAKTKEYARKIWHAMPAGEAVTQSKIRTLTGLSGTNAPRGIGYLLRIGCIEETTKTVAGRQCDAFQRTEKDLVL
jgi:hypothetical protein